MTYTRWLVGVFMVITFVMQVRNFNRYRVERARRHSESIVYLNSDVCADPITRAQLGTFNLCEKAEHLRNESPTEAAMYDILNDWYPCGHGRCIKALDWFWANIHWFVMGVSIVGMMVYFKWVEYQRDHMFTHMTLPSLLQNRRVEHVD